MIVEIKEFVRRREDYHGDYQGKPYTVYEADVKASVDGGETHGILVKTGKADIIEGLAPGQSFEAEKQDRRGFVSYKIIRRAGGMGSAPSSGGGYSGGGGGGGLNRDKSIIAQSSLKAAIEVVTSPSSNDTFQTSDEVADKAIQLAERFMAWVEKVGA